jgi:NAD-dependent DNA ligase
LPGALTTIKGVNKVDVVTLGSTFGTLAALMGATAEQLAACPGLGPTKVRRIHDTFHAPFRRTARQLRIQDAVRDGGAGATAVAPGAQQPLPAQEHVDGAGSTAAPEVQEPQQQQAEGVTDADAAAYDDVYYGDEDLGAGGGEDGFEDDEGDAQLYASAELSDEDALGV